MPHRGLAFNCQVSWENGPKGLPGCSASSAGRGRKQLPSGRCEKPAVESRGVIRVSRSQPDPVPSYPPSLRKLRPAGCPGEVTQLGSLAESGLIGPRSPAPQFPGFRGPAVPWKLGRSKARSCTPACLGPDPGAASVPQSGLRGPATATGLLNLGFFPPLQGRGALPQESKSSGGPPAPPRPETQQLSRWPEDFSSHATLSGVGKGGRAAGFLRARPGAPGGLPGCGPPPRLAGGGGEAATAPCVSREAWERGSLCPAHRELTHRVPDEVLALGGWGTGDPTGGRWSPKRAFGHESAL